MMKLLLIIFGSLFIKTVCAQANHEQAITGYVKNAVSHKPLTGATVTSRKNNVSVSCDNNGVFNISLHYFPDTLLITYIGFESYSLVVTPSQKTISIGLTPKEQQLEEVFIYTGFEKIPRERATGSFNLINNELFNRSVSTDVLTRIENVSPGILFNKGDAAQTDAILVRGRSTIYADAKPMIVLNNFPYDGDINNINPNDVENVTILKDAAAASIWGARAANGVIVITTKRGSSKKTKVELNVNTTLQKPPDIYNVSTVSPEQYIELEKFLYAKGYYASTINNVSPLPISPVVELLVAKDNGSIPGAEAESRIEALKHTDVRNDILRYFYQPLFNQQYNLNVSGSTEALNYYMSAGYDRNVPSLKGELYQRINLQSLNTFKVTRWLKLDAGINYLNSTQTRGNNDGINYTSPVETKRLNPYASLADENGDPLPFYGSYRKDFLDTVGGGKLLNWLNLPVEEIKNRQQKVLKRDYLLNLGTTISILPSLTAEIRYQYENQLTSDNTLNNDQSFLARNMINNYSQLDYNTGVVTYPVPKGGILDATNAELISHQGRAQLNYSHRFKESHQINAIAGYEIRSLITSSASHRYYGYDREHSTVYTRMDFTSYYPQMGIPGSQLIANPQAISKMTDNFLSSFLNAAYNFNEKYILSASVRKDEANLFGVKANQKGSPFWSSGIAWLPNNEKFYNIKWLPYLKLRATYGYNGNISRAASAYTTAAYNYGSQTPLPIAFIQTPPNEKLRWEKVRIINLGLDFAIKNKRLYGTVEYYWKHAKDLMAPALVDPTLGIPPISSPSFYGNVASMKTRGLDLEFHSVNIKQRFSWTTSLVFSLVKSGLTEFLVPVGNGSAYLGGSGITPIIGKPLFSMYSYRWGGLDGNSGDPYGYLDGKLSQDYSSILSSTPLDSMQYNGSVQPVRFGAIMNTFSWKDLSFSVNISYKGGYVFRTSSVDYTTLFSSWNGHGDFEKRWKQPGDENLTHVPALKYPADPVRDRFYNSSSVLVQKAGHIRLEDISISYLITKQKLPGLPFQQVRLFTYISNLGILWKASKAITDPYYNNIVKDRAKFSLGIQINF